MEPKTRSELLLAIEKKPRCEVLQFIKSTAYQNGMIVKYDSQLTRLIMCVNKTKNKVGPKNPIYYECNGMVFDMHDWQVLVIPVMGFCSVPNNTNISNYKIMSVMDGTIVTLYPWTHTSKGKVWSLASNGGYDVFNMKWIGNLTYMEILQDLFERLYPDFVEYAGKNFENLDTNYSYTIGFRHHNFHPFKADPEKVWQIHSTDLRTQTLTPEPMLKFIARQIPIECPFSTIKEIKDSLSDAINNALANMADKANTADTADTANTADTATPQINYGYILCAPSTPSILIESPLLTKIRNLIYKSRFVYPKDMDIIAINSYVSCKNREIFLKLFPEWQQKFEKYDTIVQNITRGIIHTLRQRTMKSSSKEPNFQSTFGQLTKTILTNITESEKINVFDKNIESIIKDFIMQPKYVIMFIMEEN
jgi:hypothetical protein